MVVEAAVVVVVVGRERQGKKRDLGEEEMS